MSQFFRKKTVLSNFIKAPGPRTQDPGLLMSGLDVEPLFTNIPLEEILSVCSDSFFSYDAKVNNINRIDFEKLSRAALRNSFSNVEGKIYKQIDGVATGSPLGPTLANAFLSLHKK